MVTTQNAGDIKPNTPVRKGKLTKKQKEKLKALIKKFEEDKKKGKNSGITVKDILRRKGLLESTYPGRVNIKFDKLQKNKVPLTDEERELVMSRKAVWHHGPNGEKTPAVWKSRVNGKDVFVTNTHRAYNATSTLKGAIKRYHDFIKGTA